MEKISNALLRQVLLLLLIGSIGVVLFWRLHWLLPALLGAYTLYILLRRPVEFLTGRWKWPYSVAAVFLMAISLVLLIWPLQMVVQMIGRKLSFLQDNPDQWIRTAESVIKSLEVKYGVRLLTPQNLQSISNFAAIEAQRLFTATLNGVALLAVLYFILYFMLANAHHIERGLQDWLPLKPGNAAYLRTQLNDLVMSNAIGIPFMGFVQGVAGIIMYWILDIPDAGLWFVATCLTGMLPFIGVALVYVPLSLILFSQNQYLPATVMLLYGAIVMGSVDNIARMWLMNKIGHTHPLITLFGVMVGIPLFGFIGFVFGPILVSLFLILIKLYVKEFRDTSH